MFSLFDCIKIDFKTMDWLIRVGDGENFIRSSIHRIWGVNTTSGSDGKHFVKEVKTGDRLWFVTSKSNGQIIAVATYVSHNARDLGPILNFTKSNEELGWSGDCATTSNVEVHYSNLYNLNRANLLSRIKSPKTIRRYNEKCSVNLHVEYPYIQRYSSVVAAIV